jgi:DNA-binding Lrp family transcriptional regulator
MSSNIDELDKKILHEICSGIYSYDDLARTLNVTRSTIYRRIEDLEKRQFITKKIMAIPNYDLLEIRAITVGINATFDEISTCIEILKKMPQTRFLIRCIGFNQIVAVLECMVGEEPKIVEALQEALKDRNLIRFDVSVGFKWEKMDPSPI